MKIKGATVGFISLLSSQMPERWGFFKIVHPDIFEYGVFFFSVLAFRPHINGVFGHQKRRFSKNTRITQLSKGCYRIFIALAFSSGRLKTSQSAMKTVFLRINPLNLILPSNHANKSVLASLSCWAVSRAALTPHCGDNRWRYCMHVYRCMIGEVNEVAVHVISIWISRTE